jgi:large subunit ribosomal protein L9
MAQTKVVLLERIETLGNMGEVVSVKPGYARNYLLPQKKALRASKENIAYFEAQRKHLEADNDKRKQDAEKLAKKLAGIKVPLIRQAAEGGQLYGSVTARDIALEITAASKEKIERSQVQLNQNFKLIGLFPVTVALHPEVKIEVTINIARSDEEAAVQAKTGKALIVEEGQASAQAADEAEDKLAEVLEEGALEARKAEDGEAEGEEAREEKKAKPKKKAAEEESSEEDASEEKPKKKAAKKPAAEKAEKKGKKKE